MTRDSGKADESVRAERSKRTQTSSVKLLSESSPLFRTRWIAAFALLLLAISAVPVFAEDTPTGPSGDPLPVPTADAQQLPGGADVAEAMRELDQQEADEQAALETPPAEAEREESRDAYADSSPVEAAELLQVEFAEQLEVVAQDPARALTEVHLDRVLSATDARITVDGETMLLDGSMPLRTENEAGQPEKVNLDLLPAGNGYEPRNPLTDIRLPGEASGEMTIGEGGLAISAGTEGDSPAQPFGEKDLLYPEVQTDTDLLASPVTSGLELFSQLRSEESPEELHFDLSLPVGADLHDDGEGGAEVTRDGDPLARVPAPTAVDAQGADVPVTMAAEEGSLVLQVPHREADFAYPILVDPAILQDWYNGANNWWNGGNLEVLWPTFWPYQTAPAGNPRFKGGSTPIYATFGGSNRGLFVNAASTSGYQPGYENGQYALTAPGTTTFIPAASISPFWRDDHGCGINQYPEPHDYSGLWSPEWGWADFHRDQARVYGYGINIPPTDGPNAWRAYTGHILVIGLGTGDTGGVQIPCARDLYAGGVQYWLDDWEAPTLQAVGGVPSGWIGASSQFTISATASDGGLGIRRVTIAPSGTALIQDQVGGCTGLNTAPCPANRTSQFNLTHASFDEGIKTAQVSAEDPLAKGSGTYSFQTKVDRTKPEVTLGGQLAQATDEDEGDGADPEKWDKLPFPVYNLKIEAKDGSLASDAAKRSGVKNIEVLLDGKVQPVPWQPQECPNTSCEMTKTYQLKLSGLEGNHHTLEVIVSDQLNQKRERNIEFEFFPATGMKDEYVMHSFPLADGQGNEAEEEHPKRPELAVNVANGNLVYRELDFDVEGPAVDLEVERYYNSMLPNSQNTEWGEDWTLAQTPDLAPLDTGGSPAPDEAELLDASGAVESGIALPAEVGAEKFDPALQATLEKKAGGGYELTDETGESSTSVAFSDAGKTEALLTEGFAEVDYDYEGGVLSEIAVDDPASVGVAPEEFEEGGLITQPIYSNALGSEGTANGQLKAPADVAVDAKGNLWVVDKTNNRIQKFTAAGAFVSKFGSTGSGSGQLSQPAAIALDSKGNVWVADKGNNRIQKFNENGEYLLKFGSTGTGNGQFGAGGPEGIAVDAAGNVWVADTYNGRLQKFTEAGTFVKAVSSKGSASGQLGEPTAIDVGPGGKVWVADWQNNRISAFNEAGEFTLQFGVAGSGNGQLNRPDAIDVDAQGRVWVGDQVNNRIQRFDETGKYVGQFGVKGSGLGQFNLARPMGVATDDKGSIWIADTVNNRIQKWLLPIDQPAYASSFGSLGSGNGQLSAPSDIAVGPQGSLWVADKTNNRIQQFDRAGGFVSKFGSAGSGNGQFNRPAALTVDRDGNVLVADANNNRIQKFDPAGGFISKFGSTGSGNGQFASPEGIATDFKGNIWVADKGNGRLQKFNEEGVFVKTVSSKGSGAGQLGEPTGIDIDPSGNVWVADWSNNRVSVFSESGTFLFQFGSAGSGNGQFNHPRAIQVDSHGNVWVGDQTNNRIQRFDLTGKYLGQFGAAGSGTGQFAFASPMGIATDSNGNLWVTDVTNNRIQKWLYANYSPVAETLVSDDDPSVDVDSSAGLVTKVEGEEAGVHTYAYEGQKLLSHTGPEGKTKYGYDAAKRLTSVTLPNGTTATITYGTIGRVSSVMVDPAGVDAAKTTYFEYTDEFSVNDHRSTRVTPPGMPVLTYDIGADGSVFKWWNSGAQPPEVEYVAGSLYANKETAAPISVGDHNLTAQAYSAEGIASIQFIANGDQLVDEVICEQDFTKFGTECVTVKNEWVTSTEALTPGILNLEVLVTDRNGKTASTRFWANIPPPPHLLRPVRLCHQSSPTSSISAKNTAWMWCSRSKTSSSAMTGSGI
jgi:YD repeat-containing protein